MVAPAAGGPYAMLLCRVRHALPCGGQGMARRRQRLKPRPPPPPLAANGGGRGRAAGEPLPLPRSRRLNPAARPSTADPPCVASPGRSAMVRIDSRQVRGRRTPTIEDRVPAMMTTERRTHAGRTRRESPSPDRSAASGTPSIRLPIADDGDSRRALQCRPNGRPDKTIGGPNTARRKAAATDGEPASRKKNETPARIAAGEGHEEVPANTTRDG